MPTTAPASDALSTPSLQSFGEFQLQAGFLPEIHSPVVLAWLQRQLAVSPTAKQERGALQWPQSQASVAVGAAKLVLKVDWM